MDDVRTLKVLRDIASGLDNRAARNTELTGALLIATLPEYRVWLDRVNRAVPAVHAERITANLGRAIAFYTTGAAEEFHAALVDALDLARAIDSQADKHHAAWLLAILPAGPAHETDRRRLVDEVLEWPTEGISLRTASSLLGFCGLSILAWGDRKRAERLWLQLDEMAERTADPGVTQVSLASRVYALTVAGRLEEAVTTGVTLTAMSEDTASGSGDERSAVNARRRAIASAEWRRGSFQALLHLGRYEEAGHLTDLLTEFRDEGHVPLNAHIALFDATTGRDAEAAELLAGFLSTNKIWNALTPELTMFLQTAVALGDREAAATISGELAPVANDALNVFDLTCTARHLGAASALMGSVGESRSYYDQALEACTRIRFRPEVALIRLGLAELLLGWYPDELANAVRHLDFAIAELSDMNMHPALQRALRHRAMLAS